jgi:putative ABC transport system permease protein
MLRNYFKIAFRNIIRHKGYSAVNILGLSVGLACVIVITLIIRNELSFDQFHEKKDRIFRVYIEGNESGHKVEAAPVMIPFAPAAKADIPEIEEAIRTSLSTVLSSFNNKKFFEQVLFVDEKFFDVFTFPFLTGDKLTALKEPNTLVISQRTAEKYFGNSNPVGKSLVFDNKDAFLITGVINNLPENSHLRGEIFASFISYNESNFPRLRSWGGLSNDYTYLLLRPNVDPASVAKKLNGVIISHTEESYHDRYNMLMQPLTDIHFSDLVNDDARTTPKIFLYVFGAIALFILMLAAINFINLTTARSSRRNKEVGIRKVVGANRYQLVKQFLTESFVMTVISFFIAVVITSLLIISVSELMKQELSLSLLLDKEFILVMVAILISASLLAGAYPAFVLSKPVPVEVFKNNITRKRGYSLRATLVVFQFAISVFLIIGTITVYKQTNFLLTRNLGFPSDKVVVINNNDPSIQANGIPFKQALLNNGNIIMASYASGTPGSNMASTCNFAPEGGRREDEVILQILDVDYDFLKTYDLKMIRGRYFSKAFTTDTSDAYILNEAASKKLKVNDPLRQRITIGSGGEEDSKYCSIIGVMQNFNYRSLKKEVDPIIFRLRPNGGRFLALQVNETNLISTINFIKETNSRFSPAYPFDFFFTKERFEKYYNGEKVMGKLLGFFSGLAVLISCIGILGLVSFSTEQKSKEIGVRKVLGASVVGIVIMLCKEFVKWVLISNVIIWPLAYLAMNKWLDSFAYRIDFGYLIIATTFVVSIIVTIATVSFHAIKAAVANPVESLRYE